MPLYRCHFLDNRDHIEAHEEIEADTHLEAIDRANAMLKGRPHHNVIEVWAGNRWIYRATREGTGPQDARAEEPAMGPVQFSPGSRPLTATKRDRVVRQ